MVSKEIKEMYISAARSLSDAKLALADALASDLTFGGNNIAMYLEETKSVTNAIGSVMNLLARNGECISPVEGQDGFVYMMLGGKKLICSVEQLAGRQAESTISKTCISAEDSKKVSEMQKSTEPEYKDKNDFLNNEEPKHCQESYEAEKEENAVDTEADEEEASPEELFVNTENSNTAGYEQPVPEQKAAEPSHGAKFVMPNFDDSNIPNVSGLGEIFVDEKSKPIDEFVFETYRIKISHMGIGKGEDMAFMIAPLKISKYAEANAAIVVYAYYKGRHYIRSSYDTLDDGKNIVTMQIGDYELLFRGSFNGNGVFQSMISTTGISANQGDRMVVIDKKSHCPVGKQVKNGHLKFRYTSWDNGTAVPGTMEIFPVSEEEDEYVSIAVHGEWRDSNYISHKAGGLPEVRMKTEGGMPSALICVRNGDLIEADIVLR